MSGSPISWGSVVWTLLVLLFTVVRVQPCIVDVEADIVIVAISKQVKRQQHVVDQRATRNLLGRYGEIMRISRFRGLLPTIRPGCRGIYWCDVVQPCLPWARPNPQLLVRVWMGAVGILWALGLRGVWRGGISGLPFPSVASVNIQQDWEALRWRQGKVVVGLHLGVSMLTG